MINFTITRIDEPTRTVQIKYEKEGKPAYYVRAFVDRDFNEANILDAADLDANVNQAVDYWNNLSDSELQLSVNTGLVKDRLKETKPSFDQATEKLVMQIVEDSETKTKRWVVETLDTDELASSIRNKRQALLIQTDMEVLPDRNASQALLDYRQALRDLTDQEGFPSNITWPVRPID